MQKIDRENESYDLIFHHHVLEHIENDELAFSEVCRILQKGGQMFWSVPSPTILETTILDDPKKNSLQHYRWYGKDFIDVVHKWSTKYNVTTKLIYETDTVTKFKDLIFLTEKNL
jgi:predicted SAM-dependent methyltransferase